MGAQENATDRGPADRPGFAIFGHATDHQPAARVSSLQRGLPPRYRWLMILIYIRGVWLFTWNFFSELQISCCGVVLSGPRSWHGGKNPLIVWPRKIPPNLVSLPKAGRGTELQLLINQKSATAAKKCISRRIIFRGWQIFHLWHHAGREAWIYSNLMQISPSFRKYTHFGCGSQESTAAAVSHPTKRGQSQVDTWFERCGLGWFKTMYFLDPSKI